MSKNTPEALDSKSPGVQILGNAQARGLVRSLVQSRQWWVLPVVNETAVNLGAVIERRHYLGEANADFLLILGPWPVIFARKNRMPAAALAKVLVALRPALTWSERRWRACLAEQDILVALPGDADETAALARLLAWHAWLVDGKVPA